MRMSCKGSCENVSVCSNQPASQPDVYVLATVRLILLQIVCLVARLADVLRGRHRWHAARAKHILCQAGVSLKCNSQPLGTLHLRSNELLGSSLAYQLLLRGRSAANLKQRNSIGLGDGRQPGISSSDVALPVWVFGDVAGRNCDGIVVGGRVEATGGRVAELWVHGDTGRAVGVESEQPVDGRIYTGGLYCVLLYVLLVGRLWSRGRCNGGVLADEEAREASPRRTENAVVTFLDAILDDRVSIAGSMSGEGPIRGSGGAARDMASCSSSAVLVKLGCKCQGGICRDAYVSAVVRPLIRHPDHHLQLQSHLFIICPASVSTDRFLGS